MLRLIFGSLVVVHYQHPLHDDRLRCRWSPVVASGWRTRKQRSGSASRIATRALVAPPARQANIQAIVATLIIAGSMHRLRQMAARIARSTLRATADLATIPCNQRQGKATRCPIRSNHGRSCLPHSVHRCRQMVAASQAAADSRRKLPGGGAALQIARAEQRPGTPAPSTLRPALRTTCCDTRCHRTHRRHPEAPVHGVAPILLTGPVRPSGHSIRATPHSASATGHCRGTTPLQMMNMRTLEPHPIPCRHRGLRCTPAL